jgi:hypothetical protein
MTIIAADQRFADALKMFETQVAETTQFWFAAATMNEIARRDTDTLNALNLTSSFWITARVAMEYQAILTAAKIFGRRKTNPHNIDYLFQSSAKPAPRHFRKTHSSAEARGFSER